MAITRLNYTTDIDLGTNSLALLLGGTGSVNTLDDYEEGTWTLGLEAYAGTVSSSVTRYTKIGRLVVIVGRVNLDGTADADDFQINGLPFTVSTSSSNVFGGYPTYSNSAQDQITLLTSNNNTVASVYSKNGTALTYDSFGASKQLRFMLMYFTD